MQETPIHIMLVDDDNNCNFLNSLLINRVEHNVHLHTALNGKSALEFLQTCDKDCPRLIFLDIRMPVMDGFEFLEEFQKLPDEKKKLTDVVILTSSDNEKDKNKAKQFQVAAYLTKPLTPEKVEQAFQVIKKD